MTPYLFTFIRSLVHLQFTIYNGNLIYSYRLEFPHEKHHINSQKKALHSNAWNIQRSLYYKIKSWKSTPPPYE